jgi:putative transposase
LHLFFLSGYLVVLSHYPFFLQPLPRLKFRIAGKMASQWRERWIAGQAKGIEITERIKDAERSGAPAKFQPEQILQLFKLACDDPRDYARPISHWTGRELAEELVK